MKTTIVWMSCVLVCLAAAVSGVAAGADEESVALDQVPAAVRAAIEQHAGSGKIVELERETKQGSEVYEAEIVTDGKKREIVVSAAGELLGEESEDGEDDDEDNDGGKEEEEQEVPLEEAPAAVREGLKVLLPGVAVSEVTREKEGRRDVYEATYDADGVHHEIEVSADGELLETEASVSASALPAAVVEAIEKKFAGVPIAGAVTVTRTSYEVVVVKKGGKNVEVNLLADGRMLDDDED